MKKTILLITAFICFLNFSYSQPGQLDPAFGTKGVVYTQEGSSTPVIFRVMDVQKDGKIVTIGSGFIVTRFNSDGSLDQTYVNGKQNGVFRSYGFAQNMALQNDGKIVLVGYHQANIQNSNMAIIRYNTDGSLDSTFSEDGKKTLNFGYRYSGKSSVATQSDGKIVVVDRFSDDHTSVLAIARLNNDGSLDTSFSNDGKLTLALQMLTTSTAIQSDGKIVVAGSSTAVRLNKDGSLDNTFDEDGIVTTDFEVSNIAFQSDGKIVAAGSSRENYGQGLYHFEIARYNTDGSLDRTFNDSGRQTTNFYSGANAAARSVAIQEDGKIIAAGTVSGRFATSAAALVRYNFDGSPDSSFNNDGIQITRLNASPTYFEDISIFNNKLFAVGNRQVSSGEGHFVNGVIASYLLKDYPAGVIITSPFNNATYGAHSNIRLIAQAKDLSSPISKVEFYSGTTLIRTEHYSPYAYWWNDVQPGTYTITAVSTNIKGISDTSEPVNITVEPNEVPIVSLITPSNDTTYTSPAAITLQAAAKDPDGTINKVEFYNGKTLLETVVRRPYIYVWNNVAAGNYTITAKAYDKRGAAATSAAVNITVTSTQGSLIVSSRPSAKESKTGENNAISLKLYPNPAKNTLQISTAGLQQSKPTAISVISASGVVVKTIQANASSKVVQLDVSSLVSGVYTVKIMSGDKVLYKQFVKL